MNDLAQMDKQYVNYTHASIDAMPVNLTPESLKLKVDDLNFVDEDIFVIETPKANSFVFKQKDGDEEESKGQSSMAAEMEEMANAAQEANFNVAEYNALELR